MSSRNSGTELELADCIGRLVGVDVEVLIIGARSQKVARLGPRERIYTTRMAVQLVDDVEIVDQTAVTIELAVALGPRTRISHLSKVNLAGERVLHAGLEERQLVEV